MAKSERLMDFGKQVAIVGGTAVVYAVGSNEVLRRTGLSYPTRAALGGAVGILGGGGVAVAGAPRIGAGMAIGGLFSAFTNGVNAINISRYRGATTETRAPLPGAVASQPATQTPATQQPTNGFPRQLRGVPTRMPLSPTQQRVARST
jgi:hypothetical protein